MGWKGESRRHSLSKKGIKTSQAKGNVQKKGGIKVPNKIESNKGYCVKCKQKVEIEKPKIITMKNKKSAIKGKCPNCDTKVFRIRG
ncbi:hypothetical protein KAU43_07775 [candidate division WOR-3 bacterium]|nr:hypothetical protein [candidate division WOR-3 bacterium]